MADDVPPPPPRAISRNMLAGLFAGLCVLLAVGYFAFLRADYTILYTDVKPADASAILAQLDAKGVAHRLRDDGTTIMVPAGDADGMRLAVAGSDIPMKGSVGFELFNKSDMGLTDFAQKINYQRALQGELTRTITMMEGIETARVHLAIPERSLFRGNRSVPKAAVEVIAKLGQTLSQDRVAGIQQLVASSVPDLVVNEVTILDGEGRVVSRMQSAPTYATPEVEEQAAAQNYYAARAKAALATVLPGLQVDIHALADGSDAAPYASAGAEGGADQTGPVRTDGRSARGFALRMTVVTSAPLNAEDQAIARTAIVDAVSLDERRGDAMMFEVGPMAAAGMATSPAMPGSVASPPSDVSAEHYASDPAGTGTGGWWPIAIGAVLLAALLVFGAWRRNRVPVDRTLFVEKLRAGIAADKVREARG